MNLRAVEGVRGLRVRVIRGLWEATNEGISSKYDELTVLGFAPRGRLGVVDAMPPLAQVKEPTDAAPAVALEVLKMAGSAYIALIPLEVEGGLWVPARPEGAVGPMAGGNRAVLNTWDLVQRAAWRALLEDLSVVQGSRGEVSPAVELPVHDRFESVQQYEEWS